jgi:hypothetical protein
MPILERGAPAPPDDNPTLDAIEAIRAVLMATVESDEVSGEPDHEADLEQADGADLEAPAAAKAGPFRHGRIRLHGRD